MKKTLAGAVAIRLSLLLVEKKMTRYKFAKISRIPINTLSPIMNGKNNTIRFKTLFQISNGLNMRVAEFLDDPLFDDENLIA